MCRSHVWILLVLLLLGGITSGTVRGQAAVSLAQAETSPTPPAGFDRLLSGQVLQGRVPILINLPQGDILQWVPEFSYHPNPLDTWFLLPETDGELPEGAQLVWDTTMISDGDYTLRLQVEFSDGRTEEYLVSGLRVRNYTPVETTTPAIGTGAESPGPDDTPVASATLTPTETPVPGTATPIPTNPGALTPDQVGTAAGGGALFALTAILVVSIYQALKSSQRRARVE